MIKVGELKEINLFLKGLKGKNVPFNIFVDNLHYPFIQLNEDFFLPPISNMDLSKDDVLSILEVLSKYIPEAMSGCNVLPMQKPKRESGKISLIKEISIRGYNYIYIFKIEAAYLGGTKKENIRIPPTQVTHPAFDTDRIYFSTRIIPIKNVIRADGEIIDFEVQAFDKGLFFSEVEQGEDNMPRNYSELFDEIDYTHIIEPIKIGLKILHPNWVLGKIYEPVYIEYLTLSLRFLSTSYQDIHSYFSKFYEILEIVHTNGKISENSLENFTDWLGTQSFERSTSPSGNMRWKIETKKS